MTDGTYSIEEVLMMHDVLDNIAASVEKARTATK